MRLFSLRTFKHIAAKNLYRSDLHVSVGSSAATEHLISPFGELLLRCDVDLVLHPAHLDDVSQIACLSVDLNPLFEEGFLLNRLQ